MYEEIEKEYKRKLNLNWAKTVCILLLLENVVVTFFCKNNWIRQIVWLVVLMFFTFLVVYVIATSKMKIQNKLHIISNVKQMMRIKQKRNWKNFFKILEDKNIKNAAQLRETMEFYKLKIPQKKSSDIYTMIWEIFITILPIVLACIHFKENGSLDVNVTSSLLSVVGVGIIYFVDFVIIINIAKTLYIELFDKYDVSENFVEMISWKLVVLQREKNGDTLIKRRKGLKNKKRNKK